MKVFFFFGDLWVCEIKCMKGIYTADMLLDSHLVYPNEKTYIKYKNILYIYSWSSHITFYFTLNHPIILPEIMP